YQLDNNDADTNKLGVGASVTDDFTVTTNDTHGASANTSVSFAITGTNDAPHITSTNAFSIDENSTAVTTVTASDVDQGDNATFSIVQNPSDDSHLFQITAGGALSFISAPDFEDPQDGNFDNVYDVTVKADDGHGGVATQTIHVTVN